VILTRETSLKIGHLKKNAIPVLGYEEVRRYLDDKGWNYINIYSLLKLKQAYVAILNNDQNGEKKGFYEKFRLIIGEKIDFRSMDEYLNAFKCFKVIEVVGDRIKVLEEVDFDLENHNALLERDMISISKYYFSYIRFKYFHNWFLGNISDKNKVFDINSEGVIAGSTPIFSFSDMLYFDNAKNGKTKKTRKLTDSFFYYPPTSYYQFGSKDEKESDEEKALMRFWDVFIEWGRKLGLIEKINLTQALGITCYTFEDKNLYLNYFVNNSNEIDLSEFISKNYGPNVASISLPELTANLALSYRCSIQKIHDEIIAQSANSNHRYSLQRTSAIFINGKEFIYPKIGNTFVSHIFIRDGR